MFRASSKEMSSILEKIQTGMTLAFFKRRAMSSAQHHVVKGHE